MMQPVGGFSLHKSQLRPRIPTTRIFTSTNSSTAVGHVKSIRIILFFLFVSVLFPQNHFFTTTTTTTTFITTTTVVMALPNGAPVCTVGEAAPQVKHLDPSRNPRLGHLNEGGFYIQIGDTILSDTTTVYDYNAHEDIPIVLTSETGSQPFKGVLIVMSRVGSDLSANLFLKDETQLQFLQQAQCDAGRVAVSHWNNNTKTAVAATMNFDENFDVVLVDVNIVIVNNAKASIFYWDQYKLRITGATQYPTPVPVITCGLFGMSIFCLPKITFCGFLGRLLGQDQRSCVKKNQFFSLAY